MTSTTTQPDPTLIGPSIGYSLSRCERGGGYVVWVDGAIYAACSTLSEAIGVMGRVAGEQYQEPAGAGLPLPPGDAERGPATGPIPPGIVPQRYPLATQGGHDLTQDDIGPLDRMRVTAGLVLVALMVGVRGLMGA